MAEISFLNRCIWSAISAGLADFSVSGPAQNGYTPTQCTNPLVIDGGTYHYFAVSGSDHEEGDGVYTVATATLTRAVIRNSSNGGAKVNFTNAPVVSMGGPISSDFRIKLTANIDYYVSTTGSDTTGTGSITKPWLTMQHASDYFRDNINLNNFNITVHIADGTYNAGASWTYPDAMGTGAIVWLGNNTTPANVVLNGGFHSNNGTSRTVGTWVSGFKFISNATYALDVDEGTILLGEPTFLQPSKNIFAGGVPNATVWIGSISDNTTSTSTVDLNAIMTAAGGSIKQFWAANYSGQAILTSNDGFLWGPFYNFTGTATFTDAFLLINSGTYTVNGPLGGAPTIHGKRWRITPLAVLYATAWTNFGDVAGQTLIGGTFYDYTVSANPQVSTGPATYYTVATLPTTQTGTTAYVTDGLAGQALGAIVAGSSTTPYLVWYNGTNWRIIGV